MMNAIDKYINSLPEETREKIEKLRETIRNAAPQAEETINYGIPTFKLHGNLVHFAANKGHIGFYPAPSGLEAFKKEISAYKNSKGAVQFPYDKEIPLDLITRIVEFRVKENLEKAKMKAK
ncbi:MAG: hypothetical protein HC906_04470 [Bacteroidales bacterium]|nr:hypothetical protein [Bacteroidales bacterium]